MGIVFHQNPRMTRRLNKVQASVNPHVVNIVPKGLLLRVQVGLVLVLEVVHNWCPAVRVVHVVSKARAVNKRESARKSLFLNVFLSEWAVDRWRKCVVRGTKVRTNRGPRDTVSETGIWPLTRTQNLDIHGVLEWFLEALSIDGIFLHERHEERVYEAVGKA